MPNCRKVMIIGLDCAAPEIVFERFAGQLPHLDRLRQQGVWGRLESVIPPITVPAWACMMSGKDPGRLGIYGFRNRKSHEYGALETAKSDSVQEPQLWDILGSVGMKSIVVGVPPGYPVKPLKGIRVGCFLTPDTNGDDWAYPASITTELRRALGDYRVDVPDFRTSDKDRLLADIFELNRLQFAAAEYLLRNHPWDFFILVNIAVDRMHHGFWSAFDEGHRNFDPNGRFHDKMLALYQEVDAGVGRLLECATADTAVLVVSDHGAKRIDGGICINEWLIREGLLALAGPMPAQPTPVANVGIDWTRTLAWGEGGYYGRVFVNLAGREPQGQVPAADYDRFRAELAEKLAAIPNHAGRPIPTTVFRPEEIYPEVRNVAPDLLVHFGDLHWRSIGSVGHHGIHTFENDTGPDDANHAQHGIFILTAPGVAPAHRDAHLLQIAPTVLKLLGKRIPKDIERQPIVT